MEVYSKLSVILRYQLLVSCGQLVAGFCWWLVLVMLSVKLSQSYN